ncbi:LysR family transcriptional regulator [Ralstonia mannitolilytica]|uniref:HTH-type transcriptional regulator DmlR n=1 Tax=Ralstonia mannitolilytica TaxID=105219 RepID=A0AAD2AVT2_9RALS|nr:LysR family transcriptional regulator [Ralstonia mannitolilytica]ANA33700.1 LysR family transcriptional regulator [Ralstonia mannitolilytica]MBY4720058.1 LysR family transcriptional regulator [Ralstonia mannitolilytica]CAJ0691037.1 HTH-type transcriptional regulator DmlR [Ralstonia mannitolilytica]CAJ0691714.1 HTH-type transcriptional regulator DmlR [Ralstonia mannitolilytica]CAJ0703658.1 HTH-type transcriptional regulator DmlR [Ralstonia mannitolilytica]
MDRFLSIEAFVRVAETRSFAEAARQLGVTNSVVTHRVQQLERFIEAPLFHRSTRHVRLSEVGETYYKQCAEAVCMLTDLTDQMRGLRATPVGKLRIRMLPGYALNHFAEPLARFSAQYPDIQLDVVVEDSVVDPIAEGFDVAFQIFPPINDSLIEKRLFVLRRLFCATPAYIEEFGLPQQPADLQQHALALYSGYPSRKRWTFSQGAEIRAELELPEQMRSNSVHLLRDYALTSAGIACLPTLVVSEDLLAGRLVPVLADYDLAPLHFSAVYPETQRQAVKVRALIDCLVSHHTGEPAWDVPLLERGWIR